MSIFKRNHRSETTPQHPLPTPRYDTSLSSTALRELFADCMDYEERTIFIGGDARQRVTACWLDGVVSGTGVGEQLIRPLTDPLRFGAAINGRKQSCADLRDCIERAANGGVYAYSVKERHSMDEVTADILRGWAAVIFDTEAAALCFELKTENQRSVSEPMVEKSVKGAKDAFIETLRVNTSLIRRKLRSPKLKLRQTEVGRKSGTVVGVMWMDGVAAPELLDEVQKRLDAIDNQSLIAAAELEEQIVDSPRSIFPQLIHTERPDKFAAGLLEGRVGLLADGLPMGFLLPATMPEFMRVAEDRAQQSVFASVLTTLRWLAVLLSLFMPAFYIAVAMYHQEMIPTKLLLSIIDAKQQVPFSTAAEVLGMLIAFELLQEAGLRLPDPVGQTVSIIGALIVGQSAVEAKVISPIAIIVVAITGIAGYTQPSRDMGAALRLSRFILCLASLAAGLFGLMAATVLLIWHLSGIESFGVPYLSPVAQGKPGALRRVLVRKRIKADKLRDPVLRTPDRRKQA